MSMLLHKSDIVGTRITRMWQVVELNPGDMDFADNLFELDDGPLFRLPFDRFEPISRVELPSGAVPFDDSSTVPMRASPIKDILCPENDEYVNGENMYILLESGLWISQVYGAPHGVFGIGIFAHQDCPWQADDECGDLATFFRGS